MPKLADSRFVTGPKDDLAVADVYEVKENAVRNRAEGLLEELSALLGGIRLSFTEFNPEKPLDSIVAIIAALLAAVDKFLMGLSPELSRLLKSDTSSLLAINLADFPLLWDLGAGQLAVGQGDQAFVEETDAFIKRRKSQLGMGVDNPTDSNNGEGSTSNLAAQHLVYSRLVEELIRRGLSKAIPSLLGTVTHPKVAEAVALTTMGIALNPKGAKDPGVQDVTLVERLIDQLTGQGKQPQYKTSERWESTATTQKVGSTPDSTTGGDSSTLSGSQSMTNDPTINSRKEQNQLSDETRRFLSQLVMDRPIGVSGDFLNDWEAIRELLSYVDVAVLLSKYPLFIQDILKGLNIPKTANLENFYNEVMELFDTIDPEWAYDQRNGRPVTNLNVFRYASHDAKTLLVLFSPADVRAATLLASRYRFEYNYELLKQQYPLAAL